MNMFAVIKTGGKQYKVQPDDVLSIERVEGVEGDTAAFETVLMVGDGDNITIGSPLVDGASVAYEIVEQGRGEKIIVFKKRRRQKSESTKGHRQLLSTVKITEVLMGGKKAKVSITKAADIPAGGKAEKAAANKTEAPAKAKAADAKKKAASDDKKAAAKTDDKAEKPKKAVPKAKAAKDAGGDATAQPLFAKPAGEPDDLKRISGVGPVLEKKLNALGIYTFEQVSNFTADDIERVDAVLNFKGRIERDEWVAQAGKLMSGE